MNISIVGPGSIGTLLAFKLSKGGANVELIVKPEQISKINNKLVYTYKQISNEIDIKTNTKIQNPDCIVIALKSYDVTKILRNIDHLNAPIIFCQNGLGSLYAAKKLPPNKHTAYLVTGNGLTSKAPARVTHNGSGFTYLGNISEAELDITNKIHEFLNNSGMDNEKVPNITDYIWLKTVINSAINPIAAHHKINNGELQRTRFKNLVKELCKESTKVGTAAGINFPLNPWEETKKIIDKTSQNKCSMLQDIENNKPTEINEINGEIIKIAKKYKIKVPLNELFYNKIIRGD